ncbi:hypothetical protein SDC9_127705 [bioreactor metagenome]|uniref:Uncharacterized protein n=1 Tax=bioreactor metagenome TaxID=1076179 RepID=A0A645CUU6_9ZZZZ
MMPLILFIVVLFATLVVFGIDINQKRSSFLTRR